MAKKQPIKDVSKFELDLDKEYQNYLKAFGFEENKLHQNQRMIMKQSFMAGMSNMFAWNISNFTNPKEISNESLAWLHKQAALAIEKYWNEEQVKMAYDDVTSNSRIPAIYNIVKNKDDKPN